METQAQPKKESWWKRHIGAICPECHGKVFPETGKCQNCELFPNRMERQRLYEKGWMAKIGYSGADVVYEDPETKKIYNAVQIRALLDKGVL